MFYQRTVTVPDQRLGQVFLEHALADHGRTLPRPRQTALMAASAAQKGVDSTTVISVGSTFAQMDGVLKIGSAAAVVIQPPVPGHRLQRRNAAGLLCPRHSAGRQRRGVREGVMIIPSASRSLRPRLWTRIAREMTGVGVTPSFCWMTVCT
jgi:hypothetical protein